ncbi:MAG: RHS repeat domain-containing protein [Methanosarcina sp.]|jgi:RHS repeat-associated protein
MKWYLSSDHLGSTSLMVDETGLEVERTDCFPYVKVRSGGLEKYGFTGQENDADIGLMYYGARYYSPEYRIFIQPNTMLPDPYNPQALNRYAYALNNTVKAVDNGLDAINNAKWLNLVINT